ncbi:receptor-type tyrosine-protein phosphatase kappa [Elysia marginata]|uniref:Receptor-type tyrosine-protein phosphatase kappa n=1 Tax=Elysia marginata TaxID=1093978 RepID=A0AAV4GZC0_9GAST|nr:receptor-type tyrosine-protein phosphatase kappa [Elysia marginata]
MIDMLDFKGDYEPQEWGEFQCDGVRGILIRTRGCVDAVLEGAGIHCKTERKDYPHMQCNDSTVPCSGQMWGPHCDRKCPTLCDGDYCSRDLGLCVKGCKSGYHGPVCSTMCHRGYAGKDCKVRCSNICPSLACDPVTLVCTGNSLSRVSIGMTVTALIIFLVCPGIGIGLYVLTLMRAPPLGKDPLKPLKYKSRRFTGPEDNYDDGGDDRDRDSSSSSGSPPPSIRISQDKLMDEREPEEISMEDASPHGSFRASKFMTTAKVAGKVSTLHKTDSDMA